MLLFRIDRARRAGTPLSGIGAELFGGRWNPRGTRVVYCAESRALAMLEVLAHIRNYDNLPKDRILVTVQASDIAVKNLSIRDLPSSWNAANYESEVQNFMQKFINKFCLIKVPSVIVPHECNYLINPLHPDFVKVTLKGIQDLKFDQRLILQ